MHSKNQIIIHNYHNPLDFFQFFYLRSKNEKIFCLLSLIVPFLDYSVNHTTLCGQLNYSIKFAAFNKYAMVNVTVKIKQASVILQNQKQLRVFTFLLNVVELKEVFSSHPHYIFLEPIIVNRKELKTCSEFKTSSHKIKWIVGKFRN